MSKIKICIVVIILALVILLVGGPFAVVAGNHGTEKEGIVLKVIMAERSEKLGLLELSKISGQELLDKYLPGDVPRNHWAAKSVAKLYALGILVGYPNGEIIGNFKTGGEK